MTVAEAMTNNTTAAELAALHSNNAITYYFVPAYAILFVVGTFGNGLVIASITRSPRLRTVTNTYLLNIAIADFLLLLSIPFLIVTILANGWIFGNVLCKMYYNFIHINQYISSLLLAALSFDRYLAVCHPIRAIEFRTTTKCALIIAGCWLISILFLCPTWVFATVTLETDILWLGYRVAKCVIDFPSIIFTVPPEILFTYYAFLLGFLFPVSMITTFYILVLVRLHKIRQKHKSELKQRSHRKVTRVVLAVVTAYFICWVPYWFLQIFITIDPLIHSLSQNLSILPEEDRSMPFLKELTHLTTIIGYANNCLNPVLYVFLSESFREEYLIVLNCFHSSVVNGRPEVHDGQCQRREHQSKENQRRSLRIKRRHDMAMRKIKHSVAIDDGPSEQRTLSFRFHHSKGPEPEIAPLPTSERSNGLQANRVEGLSIPYSSTASQKRHSPNRPNHSSTQLLLTQQSADLLPPSANIVDDGGVYCGDQK